MVYLILYQIFPLAFLWAILLFLEKNSAFKKYSIPVIFILGSCLQIFLCLRTAPSLINPDSYGFYLLSRGMEHDLRSILFRPKLYPFFLSWFSSLEWTLVAQGFLKIGIGGLIWTLGKYLKWRSATLSFILSLFFINALWLQEPLHILDTTVFTFLWTAFLTLTVIIFSKMDNYSGPNAKSDFESSSDHSSNSLKNGNHRALLFQQFLGLCLLAGLTSLGRQLADLSMFILLLLITVKFITKNKLPLYQIALCLFLGFSLSMVGAGINFFQLGTFKRSIALGVSLYTHESQYELADMNSPEWDYVSLHAPELKQEFQNWNTDYKAPILWTVNALPHRLGKKLENEKPNIKSDIQSNIKSNLNSVEKIRSVDQEFTHRFVNWVMEHPRFYLYSVRNEFQRMLFKCEEYYPESILKKIFPISFPNWALRLERGFIYQPLWLLLLLALTNLFFYRKSKSAIICLLLPILLYLALIAFIQLGFTRYTLPVLPGLLLLCGEVVESFLKKLPSQDFNSG